VTVTYVLSLTKKIGWAAFWATFSQAHLVTLVANPLRTNLPPKRAVSLLFNGDQRNDAIKLLQPKNMSPMLHIN
jgi:hypothetical protein